MCVVHASVNPNQICWTNARRQSNMDTQTHVADSVMLRKGVTDSRHTQNNIWCVVATEHTDCDEPTTTDEICDDHSLTPSPFAYYRGRESEIREHHNDHSGLFDLLG